MMKFLRLLLSVYAGLHLKQGRKPADFASVTLAKVTAFLRKGVLDLQLGLQ